MGIIYCISVLVLFCSYLFIRRTEEKINILKQIALNFVLLFCYNVFICYVLTFFNIPITLLNLVFINLFFSIIIILYLIKSKKVQKFKIEKIDILYIIFIGIAVIIMAYINFGFPFEIKYQTGDPSVHYIASEKFAEEDALLARAEKVDTVYGKFDVRKTASYVNSGLIMKCFQGVIDSFYNYNIFICFGIFVLFLTGWLFYSILASFTKNKTTRFLAFVFSLLYTLGYPLNSFLFGFEYFSMGILIVEAIVCSINIYYKEHISFKQNILVFFLLNFGLFTAYYMFVPYIYSGLWIYFCYNEYKKRKKLFTVKLFIMLLVTLLIPFILGYIYHIEPNMFSTLTQIFWNKDSSMQSSHITTVDELIGYASNLVNSGLSANGYMYINLFSNMILLLPLTFVAVYKKWKEDKGTILITLLNVLFIMLLIIGIKIGKVSFYYLGKNYYPLCFFLSYLSFKGLLALYENHKYISYSCIGIYVIVIILNVIFSKGTVADRVPNVHENILQVADVYNVNKSILNEPKDLQTGELEIIKYVKDNIPEDKTIEVAGDMEQGFWTYAILRRVNKDENNTGQFLLENKMENVYKRACKVNYLIYFNRGWFYKLYKEVLEINTEKVFENESGGILKYKNMN